MVDRLSAAVIGCGLAGTAHILGYEAAGVPIRAICDIDKERLNELRDHAKVATTNFREAIYGASLISIATYDHDHFRQVHHCLLNRLSRLITRHIMVEKPLCTTEREFVAIRRRWRNREGYLSSNMPLRFVQDFVDLRKSIVFGEIGDIYNIEADYVYGRINKLREGWRGRNPGYSVVLGGGVHMIDLIGWITGQKMTVTAACGSNMNETGLARYDTVTAIGKLSGGGTWKMTANFGCEEAEHSHRLDVWGMKARRVIVHSAPSDKSRAVYEFAKAIKQGTSPPICAEDVLRVTETCLQIEQMLR